jgi:hypothetical protein
MWQSILKIIEVIASQFDPELKKKRYRVKLTQLKDEKKKLMKIVPCTSKISKRLEQIETEMKNIELYLQS